MKMGPIWLGLRRRRIELSMIPAFYSTDISRPKPIHDTCIENRIYITSALASNIK